MDAPYHTIITQFPCALVVKINCVYNREWSMQPEAHLIKNFPIKIASLKHTHKSNPCLLNS